jgi:hypothetical protein
MTLPTAATPIAKSLHTLTVLQQVAGLIHDVTGVNDLEAALDGAMARLGLAGRPDPYGLRARALELMARPPKGPPKRIRPKKEAAPC